MPIDQRQRDWEPLIQDALERRDTAALTAALAEVHAADLAELFDELNTDERLLLLEAMPDEQVGLLLGELEAEEQAAVLDLLPDGRTSHVLDEMSSDEAADLLADLPSHEADALMERMEPEQAGEVAALLRYEDDTAGGLMATEFVRVGPDDTVADALVLLRRHHDDAEMIYYLYVLDEEERLLGVVTLRRLIVNDPAQPLAELMYREFVSVPPEMPQEEVARLVRRHDLLAVPVLDEDGRLLGIVTVDDIGDVVQEEAAEDLLDISGGDEGEEPHTHWSELRGWRTGLLALLGGAAGAALILLWFPAAREPGVLLLLPLMLVLGLITASQTAQAVDQTPDAAAGQPRIGRTVTKEILAGALLALTSALLAGSFSYCLQPRQVVATILTALAVGLGVWTAPAVSAIAAGLLRRAGRRLTPISHILVVVFSLLAAVLVYLLAARWVG